MKNLFRLFGIIALVTVIGFSIAACGGGDDGDDPGGDDPLAKQLNGTWKTGNNESLTLKNGSFVKSQNNKQSMRGTYKADARSLSANLTMDVKELYGDYLNESEDLTFESKWYNKAQVTDAYRKWLKGEYPILTDAQITTLLKGRSGEIDAMFPIKTAAIDGDSMTLDGMTYTKDGGTTPVKPGTGMTWTAVTNSTFDTSIILAIAYGNNKFVAGDADGKMAYSSDGVTWTAIPPGYNTGNVFNAGDNIEAIAFGNDTFVAVGDWGHANRIAYSSNGITWTAVDETAFNYPSNIYAVAFGNNMFVAGGSSGKIAYSSNGVTWTAVTTNAFEYVDDNDGKTYTAEIEAIAYGNNIFVAVGADGRAATSTDGIRWTAVTTNAFDYVSSGITYKARIQAIAFGNGTFVAGCGAYYGNGWHGKLIATSTDGKNWTPVNVGSIFIRGKGSWAGVDAIAFGNNKFVALANTGSEVAKVATSADGVTWTAVTDNPFASANIFAIAYGSNKFVAGGTGKMWYSSDGSGNSGNTPQTETYTGTSGSTNYTLKITENTARYAAKSGDAYELTAGTKKSAGKVNSVSGGVLTLKPSNATATFTATVSGTSLTALNNTITWTDGTTASAPGALTGGSNPGTGSGGTFTVTGIPAKYNGKYAYFVGIVNAVESIAVSGYQYTTGTEALNTTYTRISNGRVSMPTWLNYINDNTSEKYSGNDTVNSIGFYICNYGTVRENGADVTNTIVVGVFMPVTFTNGSVTKSRNDAFSWDEDPYK
jgi:hypothetical protein